MKKLVLSSALILCAFLGHAQQFSYKPDSAFKQQIIKIEFFSPMTGNLTLGYERYLKNSTSLEVKLGAIGVGRQDEYDARGAFIKIGPKFKLEPDYATADLFGTHLLRGSYIRPELIFGYYTINESPWDIPSTEENVRSFSIMINYGKQHILGKIMSLDWFVGLGYGFSNVDDQGYYFSHFAGSTRTPIAFNAGFTLGFLFK